MAASEVRFCKRFNFFTGTFKGFCRNIPELLLREIHLSMTLARNVWLFFVRLYYFFLVEIKPDNKFLDVTNKKTTSCDTVIEVIYYELGVVNLYLDGAAIIVLNYLLVFII